MAGKALNCGVLVFNPQGELLLGHATGSPRWDIPKGIAEEPETPLAAALREAAEETGLQLAADALLEVGRFAYLRGKDLALFAALVEGLDAARCVCTSTFCDAKGHERPEFDAFRWVSWDQVPRFCGRSLAAVLAAIDPAPLLAGCRALAAPAALGRGRH